MTGFHVSGQKVRGWPEPKSVGLGSVRIGLKGGKGKSGCLEPVKTRQDDRRARLMRWEPMVTWRTPLVVGNGQVRVPDAPLPLEWYDEEAFFSKNARICNGCEHEEIAKSRGWFAGALFFIKSWFVRNG